MWHGARSDRETIPRYGQAVCEPIWRAVWEQPVSLVRRFFGSVLVCRKKHRRRWHRCDHIGRAKPADFARFAGLKCSSSVYAHFGNLLEGGSADELKLS